MAEDKDIPPQGAPQLVYSGETRGPAYERWREEFGRRILATDFSPIGEGAFHRAITPAVLPNVKISASVGSAMTFTTLASSDDLALMTSRDSPLDAVMGKRSLHVTSNGFCLGDTGIKGSYMSQLVEGRFSALLIDRKTLLSYCPDAEDRVGRPIAPNSALTSLFGQYYDLVVQHAASLDSLTQAAVAQHLIDLAALTLGAGRDAAEEAKGRGLAAARFEAIKADILSRLGDGNLSLGEIAKRHRASPRYIQMLFERAGTTFSEFVLEQRLLYAHRLLGSPLNSGRKISDIAHMAGFGDVSYFHRSFRRRFGATPAEVREDR